MSADISSGRWYEIPVYFQLERIRWLLVVKGRRFEDGWQFVCTMAVPDRGGVFADETEREGLGRAASLVVLRELLAAERRAGE